MPDQKFENLLNVSMQTTKEEREKSLDLNVGIGMHTDIGDNLWEIIVKHTGSISYFEELFENVRVIELLNGYAVILLPEELLDVIASFKEIEYIEKPKLLYFQDYQSFSASCITSVKTIPYELSGEGVITAIIDSGINILLPEFQKSDGTTRIINLWDQSVSEEATDYYTIGREYGTDEINTAIAVNEQLGIDLADHGTPVASLACGNSGIANESDIIIVKLATAGNRGFPRTTQIMMGIDYVLRKAAAYGRPVAINLSLGNNYGSHKGASILERYIEDAGRYWKCIICTGSGNEAASATHAFGTLINSQEQFVRFAVSNYQPGINLQVWKNYSDDISISLITPDGREIGPLSVYNKVQRFELSDMSILGYLGEPTPYNIDQEIYFDFIPKDSYILSGIWQVRMVGNNIIDGNYNMWLPSDAVLNRGTGFLESEPYNTLTIPSTTQGTITVGAYDARNDSYASFSGRGRKMENQGGISLKPDLVAPGVMVGSVSVNGGVRNYSGTSFATPIVTGSAALLMQWGIVNGNDPYLYGEKIKAYLLKGARQLSGFESFPNSQVGWGALCLENSIPR